MRKISISTIFSISIAVAIAFAVSGCATVEGGGGPRINLLSTQDEIALGTQLSAEVEKQERVLDNPAIQAYVQGIGARVSRNAPRQDVPYVFTVIDNPTTVNAFALPGGHMYVYTGLMKLCENEAELASVMAHEIAHVAGHHHGEAMTRQYGMELVMSVLLGENPRMGAQIVGQLIGTAGAMRYSRQHEYEADSMGVDLLFRSGYKPEAMVSFMEKMLANEGGGRSGMLNQVLASHPETANRIENLRTLTMQYPLDDRLAAPVYAERYQSEVLSKLK